MVKILIKGGRMAAPIILYVVLSFKTFNLR